MAGRRNKNSGYVQAGLASVGAVLVASDASDIGKVDRVHHWQIGAGLILVALLF